mgnify:CR=1 FL=1
MPTVTTTVTSACASGVVTTETITQATPEKASTAKQSESAAPASAPAAAEKSASPLVVYNWPMMGRFGAQFLMLDHAGIEYEHIESLEKIVEVGSAFGAKTGEWKRAKNH